MRKFLSAFWRFTRPHTIIGTTLSVTALYFLSFSGGGALGSRLHTWWWTLISCLAANIYIVGLNQLQDVEIDRVNKPYLPLAAGDFSLTTGRTIIFSTLILSIFIAADQGIFLLGVVLISMFLGTIYSLRPFRLKRFPFWAAFSIFTVRGFVVNIGIYLHFRHVAGGKIQLPPEIWTLTLFMLGFSLIIAWFKDIPDLKGDLKFHIRTYALNLGPATIFRIGLILLSACYAGAVIAGIFLLAEVNHWVFAVSHSIAWIYFLYRSIRTTPENQQEMTRHYQFIWKLFYLEYIIFPAAYLIP